MYWEEQDNSTNPPQVPDTVVDAVYSISCRTLPVDHAFSLAQAVQQELPWIQEEKQAGVHTIHVAESGNGWFRPDSADQLLYPSKRTKLVLRLPNHRIDDAGLLVNKSIDVDGNNITIKKMTQRKLSDITTIFSRYIVMDNASDEIEFMERVVSLLGSMHIRPKRMLCGREMVLQTPDGPLVTRSLMIADLKFSESLLLQQEGLGSHRWMGCGLFLPHKNINEIGETMG